MSKSKALLFDLSGSISFGRLSLLGKVLFPMLVLKSDDQGRGLAESDAIKWKVCPSVQELTIEAIEGVLQEMADERIDLLHLYQDSRGRKLYQFKRWWVPDVGSGSCLQWARPSEYEAPDGWTDRVRVQQGPGKPPIITDWDLPGGFVKPESSQPQDAESPEPLPDELPNQLGNQLPKDQHGGQNNLTKNNLTQPKGNEANGASAPSPTGDIPPPLPTDFQGWLDLIEKSSNRPAALVRMYSALFPTRDPPDFGYIGKTARKVGGAGRLASLMWQAAAARPTGDVLAYCQAMAKGGKPDGSNRDDSGISIQGHVPRAATTDEFYAGTG